jgi:hypothetical protein
MDSLCLCWRGNPGTGKRTQLLQHLQLIAKSRNLPFGLHTKFLQIGSANASSSGEVEEDDETTGERITEQGQVAYESSVIHIGFDVSRMSMQDKNILRPVFLKLGQGSQVLLGSQERGSRILVLYHAHLLSTESILLLQSALEQNDGDLSVWMTSEIPVPLRIRDWFVEVPVGGSDKQFEKYTKTILDQGRLMAWPDIFTRLFTKWLSEDEPTLKDVPKIKAFVYELLMRNLRWTECIHFVLDAIILLPGLPYEQRQKALSVIAACEGTGGGQTLPSYRIPILWESLFLQLRTALSTKKKDKIDGASTVSPRNGGKRKKAVAAT